MNIDAQRDQNPWATDTGVTILKDVLSASLYDESAWTILDAPMDWQMKEKSAMGRLKGRLRSGIVRFLGKRGFLLVKTTRYDAQKRAEGLEWPMFGYSMVGQARLDNLEKLTRDVIAKGVPGDLVETGVWRGGCTILMKAIVDASGDTTRKVWCCDSFEGLPPPNETDQKLSDMADFSECNFLSVSKEQVQANFKRFGLLDDRVMFLKGWFSDTLPTAPIDQIAVLRMDGDLYESTMDALGNLYDKVSDGGYIIIDDYYSWTGCRTAVDEFRESRGIHSPLEKIDAHSCYWRVDKSSPATKAA